MLAVSLAIKLVIIMAVGFFAIKSNILQESFTAQLNTFVMKIALPAMIFNSISSAPAFTADTLSNCLIIMAASAAVMFISLGIGELFYAKMGKSGMGRIIRYSLTFTNFSFMGIPIVDALFGEVGNLYYVFFMVAVRIFYYTLSQPLMTPPELRPKKSSKAQMAKGIFLNPALITVAIGMVFWISGLKLPDTIGYSIKQVGGLCSPLGLMLCGMRLGCCDFKSLLKFRYIGIPMLRLVMMPALFLVPIRMLANIGVDPLICNIIMIYTALPIAALLPVYTMQYDPNEDNQLMAAGASAVSAMISTITIPLWCLLVL